MWFVLGWILKIGAVVGASWALNWLTPKKYGTTPGAESVTLPTAEEGRIIPHVVGTNLLEGANLLWSGDSKLEAVTYQTKDYFHTTTRETGAFRYFMGMQLGICLGAIDAVEEIRFDDRRVAGNAIVIPADCVMGTRGIGGVWDHTFTFPAGSYPTMAAACDAVNTALWASEDGFNQVLRLVYGLEVITDVTDTLTWEVNGQRRTCKLSPRAYNHLTMIRELNRAMNAVEALYEDRVIFTWSLGFTLDFQLCLHLHVDRSSSAVESLAFSPSGINRDPYACFLLGMQGVESGDWDTESFPAEFDCNARAAYRFAIGTGSKVLGPGSAVFMSFEESAGFGLAATTFGFQDDHPLDNGDLCAESDRHALPIVQFEEGADFTTVALNAPNLFGDDDGVTGNITIYRGTRTQLPDDYLEDKIGGQIPAHRGLCYAVLRQLYFGRTAILRAPSFVVRRCPNGLGLSDGHENIAGDANPACVIYDLLTNPLVNRRPLAASLIELADLVAMAEALYLEGLGVSFVWDSAGDLADRLDQVLTHVDGARWEDPETGKLRFALVRADYDVETLPVADVRNVASCAYANRSWGGTKNMVRLRFRDRANDYKERVVGAYDSANIWTRGGEIDPVEVDFPGYTVASVAQRGAERHLKGVSWPGSPLELVMDRSAWNWHEGMAFLLNWAPLGISNRVCRVASVDRGSLEDRKITVTATPDIWGSAFAAFTAPQPSEAVTTDIPPGVIHEQRLEEVPYALIGANERRLLTLAVRPTGLVRGYRVWSDSSGGYEYAETGSGDQCTPSGILLTSIGPTDTELTLTLGSELDRVRSLSATELAAGRGLLLLDDELIAYQGAELLENGNLVLSGLVRGCCDTVPASHAGESGAPS